MVYEVDHVKSSILPVLVVGVFGVYGGAGGGGCLKLFRVLDTGFSRA